MFNSVLLKNVLLVVISPCLSYFSFTNYVMLFPSHHHHTVSEQVCPHSAGLRAQMPVLQHKPPHVAQLRQQLGPAADSRSPQVLYIKGKDYNFNC